MMMRWGSLLLLLGLAGCPDDDNPQPPPFHSVALDATNTGGAQFQSPEFPVAQGVEEQDCYFFSMPDLNGGQDYWVDHIRLGVNPGSHHLNLFRVKTIVNLNGNPGDVVKNGECFKSGNWGDWPLIANDQESAVEHPYFDWHLPTNVAYRFSPGEKIMIQTHYVNASTQMTPFVGKFVADFYKSTLAAPIELGTLFATEQSIRICQSQPNPTYHGTCLFNNATVQIAAANGHFHSRGVEFDIFNWDGVSTTQPPVQNRFYQSLTWDDPPMMIYDPNAAGMTVPAGGGVWWNCEYQWQPPAAGCDAVNARDAQHANDCCYTFGPVVETSEHCNLFLYYFPKVNGTDITCF